MLKILMVNKNEGTFRINQLTTTMNRIYLRRTVFIIALLLSGLFSKAQGFDSLLNKLDTLYPQEKLYLQFDKSGYNPGETIWFKAYALSSNILSNISKNIYAELIDGEGKILQRKVLPVLFSSAATSFELPTGLTDSVLFVRAYTRWMLNFDSSFLYVKTIPIFTGKVAATKKPASTSATSLQFFPEGGDLVAGLESNIAFKATDNRGLPAKTNGDILNSKGEKVASFMTRHDGMGVFRLNPVAGEQYKATWKDQQNKSQESKLPAAQPSGVVMELSQDATGILFNIRKNGPGTEQIPAVYVVAQIQQQMVYQAKANLSKASEVRAVIPTDNIPTGIVQVTLFTLDRKPLAERIIFVNHQDYYFITDLNVSLKTTAKRGKNVIQIDVPDTLACNLSLSVTDAAVNPVQAGDHDIYSQVLLTSDIKGYVHNPAYYFSSDADSLSRDLDLVMMTNGWRRFKWEDLLANRWPKINEGPEDYLTIIGKINGLNKSELVNQEITGILMLKNEGQQIYSIPVQRDGSFYVPGLLYYDTARLFYQFNNDKNKVLTSKALIDVKNNFLIRGSQFHIDPQWISRIIRPEAPALLANKQMTEKNIVQLEAMRKTQTLAGVTVVAKQKSKKDKMDEEYSSGLFKGGDGYTFITEDDPFANSSQTVLQYLQGKVAGLQITGAGQQMNMSWRGGTPSLFMNEMQTDLSMVQTLNMSDIAMIKVFRPPFFGAPGGGSGGAIAVYTKKGAASYSNVKGLDFAKIPGYTPEKQFYSPDYSKELPENSQDDNRTTLYWNPFIITDKNSRRTFYTFYNNDVSKKFRIIIEGVNADGKLTRAEKIIE
jgi:hypothetical protein